MPYAPTPYLLVETDGPVTILTMNNPDMRNAFVDELHEAMQEIWMHLSNDDSVRAVVLTGAGTAFSAGGNIPDFIRSYEDPDHRRKALRGAKRLMDAMTEFPKPVVTAVNGAAVGLGCNVALGGDLVLMAERAFMADTHVSIGLVAGDGGAVIWPALIGFARAKEFLMTGDMITAPEAARMGLINHAVPAAELDDKVMLLANRLAKGALLAIRWTKRSVNLQLRDIVNRVLDPSVAYEAVSNRTSDHKEAVDAFLDKRRPVFRGR